MVKTLRNFGAIYSDFLLIDESILFIGKQIDKLDKEFDVLIEKNPESEQLQKICGQIATLYGKSSLELKKLREISDEIAEFGVPIPVGVKD